MAKDLEEQTQPLLPKVTRPWLEEYEEPPVGGYPGNSAGFSSNWQIALRCAFNATLLGCIIWIPATKPYVNEGFAKYVPLTILMIFFNIAKVFGVVVDNTSGVLLGTICAFLNIFIMRGFFPDGVTPEHGLFAGAAIAGWLDLAAYNMFFLVADVRPMTRCFALAHHTGFMLSFLNPNDSTPFSKNFKLNLNGTAFQCVYVTMIACCLTLLAHLLPYPFEFARASMKDNAKRCSAYVSKCFIGAADYYDGSKPSVQIERQKRAAGIVESTIGGLGASIGGAWWEGFDLGSGGVIRGCHVKHSELMSELLDVVKAIQAAIESEDFGESHQKIMAAIGKPSKDLVDSTGELLMSATEAARDGDVAGSEKDQMQKLVDKVKDDLKALCAAFDSARRDYTAIHPELLSESFFVFAISKYARKVTDYATMLMNDPPRGESAGSILVKGFAATFTLAQIPDYHFRVASRTWIALMVAFLYGVHFDNYGGACAITAVFLASTRTSPDIETILQILLAVTIASCVGAIIFQRSCQLEVFVGPWVLPLFSFIFWWFCLYCYFAGGTFELIGLLCSALSAFVLVARCPETLVGSAQAVVMWVRIRGFILALLIMTVAEVASTKGALTTVAKDGIGNALHGLERSLDLVWNKKNPAEVMSKEGGKDSVLDVIGRGLADATEYGKAAREEPRFWREPWNYALLTDLLTQVTLLDLDFKLLRAATTGADGKCDQVFDVLSKVPQCEEMKNDLLKTLKTAHDLTAGDDQSGITGLLGHEAGPFKGMDALEGQLEGLDKLDGYEEAMEKINQLPGFGLPTGDLPGSIEDDLCVQISIVFLMFKSGLDHTAGIVKSAVRNS